jgi:hypothetical protein
MMARPVLGDQIEARVVAPWIGLNNNALVLSTG